MDFASEHRNGCNVESYHSFLERIYSFEKPFLNFGTNNFQSNPSLRDKVDKAGNFRDFVGDTVVFDLDLSQKRFLEDYYINPLYDVAYSCFAEKLKQSTLHMTLHDLNTSVQCEDIEVQTFETQKEIAKKTKELALVADEIEMQTTYVFNMVNTSLVLGLKPKTEKDYDKLMRIYASIDSIHSLPYPFTPHITLAYYRREGFGEEQILKIQNLVNQLNQSQFSITLSTNRLYYQRFASMNDYFSVIPFVNI